MTPTENNPIRHGKIDGDIQWILQDGNLLLNGYGCVCSAPWEPFKDEIRSVITIGMITDIGPEVFSGCKNLVDASLWLMPASP